MSLRSPAKKTRRRAPLHQLEPLWRQNGGHKSERAETLSSFTTGRNLVLALHGLHLFTEDARFAAAIKAITENGVLDGKARFKKNWKGALARRSDDVLCVGIDDMHRRAGWSVRKACAEFAAAGPIHAASFATAIKKATNLYKTWLKNGGRERCANMYSKLEDLPPPKNSKR